MEQSIRALKVQLQYEWAAFEGGDAAVKNLSFANQHVLRVTVKALSTDATRLFWCNTRFLLTLF